MTKRRPEPTRPVLFAVAVLPIAALVWFWSGGGGGEPAPATGPGPIGDAVGRAGMEPLAPDAPVVGGSGGRRDQLAAPREGAAVQGIVLDRNARPLEGVHVLLNGPGDADPERSSDAYGRFEAEGLVVGTYQIVATGAHLLTHSEFVKIRESDELVELRLEVDTGVALAGQVVDEDRRPVADAKVTPWRRGPSGEELEATGAVTSDGAGRFELRGAPDGPTYVLVEYPGYPPTRGRLEATRLGVVVIRRSD